MKENLKIKSSLSFRAIEAMALKASALAKVRNERNERKEAAPATQPAKRPHPARPKSRARTLTAIERDIRAILRSLSSQIGDDFTVVTSKSSNGADARWTASVYRTDDHCRQKEEAMRHSPQPYKATPVEKYVFYPDTLSPERIGSVAIYGHGATIRKAAIDKAGNLFGHRVAVTSLEMGRRLFVDVKFAA